MKDRVFRNDLQALAQHIVRDLSVDPQAADIYIQGEELSRVGICYALGIKCYAEEEDRIEASGTPPYDPVYDVAMQYADRLLEALPGLLSRAFVYEFPKADNTVDACVFGLEDDKLKILLIERGRAHEPFYGCWALPGGFINIGETLDTSVVRELQEETGVKLSYVEQLSTFGNPERDPRGRVISTAWLGFVRPGHVQVVADDDAKAARWFSVDDLPEVAFDHAEIIQLAIERLRSKVRWQPIGFGLLPEEFTLTELQRVYEIVLGTELDKRNFRRKVLSFNVLIDTGKTQGDHRPAALYRFNRGEYNRMLRQGLAFEV